MIIVALSSVKRAVGYLVKGLSFLAQFALVSMVVTICYDVVMRYVFSKPTLWSLEINTFLIVFLALIPAGDVLRSDKHFKITFFQDKLGVLGHKIQAIGSNLLGCAFCSIMILEGYEMMFLAWRYEERMSTSLGTPLFLPYLLIPLGFGALLLQFLINLVSELFSQRFTEKDDDSFLNADSHTSKT